VFYSIGFFLIFMIQIIFITSSIQIFHVLPDRVKRGSKQALLEAKKRTHAYSGKIPFQEWYYSFDYQVPFVTSVFTICLSFSSSLPLILPCGLIFFIGKFIMDFNQRVLLGKTYFSADMKHSNNTVRSSIVKYLFCSCVLYLFLNGLIYSASPTSINLLYVNIGLSVAAFVVCCYFWIRWKLATNPKIGNNFDEEQLLAHKERFDLKVLSENYRHPL
jgi:hypothetical protein